MTEGETTSLWYEVGGIDWENAGADVEASNRFRTGIIPFDGAGYISITGASTTYAATIRGYDSDQVYAASNGSWINLPGLLEFSYPYIRLQIKRTDEADVSASELNGCILTVDSTSYELYLNE